MVSPWRLTKGVEPCAMKVASTVLNGEDEETDRKALRLVLTQLRFQPRLCPALDARKNPVHRTIQAHYLWCALEVQSYPY